MFMNQKKRVNRSHREGGTEIGKRGYVIKERGSRRGKR